VYFALSLTIYLAGRKSTHALSWISLAIALVDVPAVFWLAWAQFPTSHPASIAGFNIGLYMLMLVLAAFALEGWKIYFTAAIAAMFEGLLQWLAGVSLGAIVATAILLAATAFACAYGSRRLRNMVIMVADAQKNLSDRARDNVLAVASHELRSPFATFKLQLQKLAINKHTEPLGTQLDNIGSSLDQLDQLIASLLDVSSLSSKRVPLEIAPVDLVSLIKETIERASDQLAAAGCQTRVLAPPSLVGHWDRMRLTQVLSNLLTNALKYGSGKPIELRLTTGDGARLEIRDQGIGIDAADTERIFARFERAVPLRQYSGFGIGLWISKEIVEAHGGSIEVSSVPNQGSSFVVELPLDARETPPERL
jgi:signal transduction histidine kinase